MKNLIFLRHGKSSWEIPGINDADRPLASRGIKDGHLISRNWPIEVPIPQKVFSSYASRASHTALIFCRVLNIDFKDFHISDALYFSGFGEQLNFLKALPDNCDTIMVVGHNPSISDLAENLSKNGLNKEMPTTGLVAINFHVNHWKDIGEKGEVISFEYPKKYK